MFILYIFNNKGDDYLCKDVNIVNHQDKQFNINGREELNTNAG